MITAGAGTAVGQPADQTVQLSSAADAYVDLNNPNANAGSGQSIDVGHDTAPSTITRRALIRWDLSPLFEEQAAEIISAVATFRCGQLEGPGFAYGWHLVTSSWSESTVTWNTQPTFQAAPTTSETAVTVPPSCSGGAPFVDDVTPLVAAWVEAGTPNHGMVGVSSNESLDAHAVLRSKEHAVPPVLEVQFARVLPRGGISGVFGTLGVALGTVIFIAAVVNVLLRGFEKPTDVILLVVGFAIFVAAWGFVLAGGLAP